MVWKIKLNERLTEDDLTYIKSVLQLWRRNAVEDKIKWRHKQLIVNSCNEELLKIDILLHKFFSFREKPQEKRTKGKI